MSYCVMTDTSANLPSELLKEREIRVIAFPYFVGGEEHTCIDTEQFDGKAYYNKIRNGAIVTTSQINPLQYAEVMRPILQEGNDLLFVGMSSGISGSFHSAELAAETLCEEFPDRRIELVDALTASLGEGIPALKAADLRDSGVSLNSAAKMLRNFCTCMCSVFTVDDLMHLKRTGRISGAVAVVGTVFQIKPLLKGNEEGKIVTYAKARGRKKAIEMLAEKYRQAAVNAKEQIVGIAHADCPEDAALLAGLIRKAHPPKEILTVCYEPVTGSHVGPGTLALFFEGDRDVRK